MEVTLATPAPPARPFAPSSKTSSRSLGPPRWHSGRNANLGCITADSTFLTNGRFVKRPGPAEGYRAAMSPRAFSARNEKMGTTHGDAERGACGTNERTDELHSDGPSTQHCAAIRGTDAARHPFRQNCNGSLAFHRSSVLLSLGASYGFSSDRGSRQRHSDGPEHR